MLSKPIQWNVIFHKSTPAWQHIGEAVNYYSTNGNYIQMRWLYNQEHNIRQYDHNIGT